MGFKILTSDSNLESAQSNNTNNAWQATVKNYMYALFFFHLKGVTIRIVTITLVFWQDLSMLNVEMRSGKIT